MKENKEKSIDEEQLEKIYKNAKIALEIMKKYNTKKGEKNKSDE